MSQNPPSDNITVAPGPRKGTVLDGDGQIHDIPDGWEHLPPGDSGLTRRTKSMGPTWTVVKFRGKKKFSQGLWAPAGQIARAKEAIEAVRADPKYEKKRASDKARRELKQVHYVHDFRTAVCDFLYFHESYKHLEGQLADAVSEHATPVGSGTVARTSRLPIERRAQAAVIAWMRHQTTAYDDMSIPREKGLRREVRRELAARSRRLLNGYRNGDPPNPNCPLAIALGIAAAPVQTAVSSARDEERQAAELENKRRVAAGLPPTPWPAPPIDRPRGGWATD